VPTHQRITCLGEGPAIRVMDASLVAHRKIVDACIQAAEESDIPYQLQISPRSGTDAGVIALTRQGIPSGVISVPCRYIHSPCCIASLEDVENTIKLLSQAIGKLCHDF